MMMATALPSIAPSTVRSVSPSFSAARLMPLTIGAAPIYILPARTAPDTMITAMTA
jgi:hypothetical protein